MKKKLCGWTSSLLLRYLDQQRRSSTVRSSNKLAAVVVLDTLPSRQTVARNTSLFFHHPILLRTKKEISVNDIYPLPNSTKGINKCERAIF
jgi:hypothetical protein